MAELGERNIREVVDQEVSRSDISLEESMPTEWTNEKHRSYLNSMEAMFVKQLYNDEYNTIQSQGWRSRRKNPVSPSSSGQLDADTHTSGQLKILQRGCWKKINVADTQHGPSSSSESHIHLQSPKNPQNIIRHSKIPSRSPGFQSDPSRFNYREVSDQNFVEDDNESMKMSNPSRKKRTKAKDAIVESIDQVVPTAMSSLTKALDN